MTANDPLSQVDSERVSGPRITRVFWERLVEPVVPMPEDDRRRARLFAWLLLTFLPLVGLSIASFFAFNPAATRQNYPGFAAAGGAATILFVAYLLNRAGRYTPAAVLTIVVISLGLWAAVVAGRTNHHTVIAILPFLIVCVLLSSILLSVRATVFVAAVHIAISLFLLAPVFVPGLESVVALSLWIFMVFTSTLIVIVATLWRYDQNQLERQTRKLADDIAERRRAEEGLRRSEERFQLVARATNDAVWDWDLLTGEEWWNEGLQKLFYYPPDQVVPDAKWWSERVHPEDRQRVVRSIEAANSGDAQSWSHEYRFRRADGLYADVFDRGYILRDDEGKALRMIGAMMDVTDRKRAEEALREAEEKYRNLVEQLPAVVYVAGFGEAAPWTYVSPQIESLLGFSPEEWMADSTLWYRQMHPEDRERVMAGEAEDRETGEPGGVEYRMLARDGRLVWVRDEAYVVRDQAGHPSLYQGVIVDITERKRAEEALQEAHEQLTQSLKESEQRSREIGLLNEMGGLLQACLTEQEAYTVIAPLARQLFPDEAGALCVIGASRNLLEAVAVWNAPDKELNPRLFAPEDCWALRRGRTYVFGHSGSNLPCRHIIGQTPAGYLCVPLMAQGEALGVLHLRSRSSTSDPAWARSIERQRQLAQTAADGIALAVANLRLRETLRHQSIRDPLTGLFNRRYMEETLQREMRRAARGQRPLGIMLLDLDRFKRFNDTYGHAAGDALLRKLGGFLTSRIRAEDAACRYGGEEFLIILPEASLETARQRAEQIREEVRYLLPQYQGQPLEAVTVSLGVAVFPDHGSTSEAILRVADEALYRAKREGRNRVVVARAPDA